MRRQAIAIALFLLPVGWVLAGAGLGMIGHMAGHMIAVAVAAPLLAYGLGGGRFDPARRWPRVVAPMPMMLVELAVVWLWHLPALRAAAHAQPAAMVLEQASFLIAGWLLWSAAFHRPHRTMGIGALLLTSMHMTLLGVLIGLADRPLYADAGHGALHGLGPVADQQLGGVVMLLVGAVSYLAGGLALLADLLRYKGVMAR